MEKKYFSLYSQLKNKILTGVYDKNEKLESKRVMADKFGCSVITVEKAYSMLEEEGYIFSKERKGYYVIYLEADAVTNEDKKQPAINHLPPDPINYESDFEYSVWFKTVRKVISEKDRELFSKSPSKGCSALRNALADYLLRYRGMFAQPENIIIGSGSQQLYEFVVKLLGRDKIYGIEYPSFEYISSVYTQAGAKVCNLTMGSDGIIREELNVKKFDVLHVTPFHSYPTGITAPVSKRLEYLAWANRSGGHIVEDDFDSEFFMPGQPIETLYSLDRYQKVIYINTFSKSLSPSMRMGYMILPDELLEKYDKLPDRFSCSVPVMDQYVLAEFISNGNFERHLNRQRRKLKAKGN